jgi:HlyD family secretion protein
MLEIPKAKRNYRLPIYLALTLLVLTVLYVALINTKAFINQKTDSETLVYEAVVADVVSTIRGVGRLYSRNSSVYVAKVNGIVTRVNSYPGQYVERGDIVIELENPDLKKKLSMANLEWLQAKADAESRNAELDMKSIELSNKLAIKNNEIRFAQKEYETIATLFEKDIVSQLDFLRVEIALERVKQEAELAAMQAEAFAKSKISTRRAVEFKIEAANSKLELAKLDVSYLSVKANTSGLLSDFFSQFKEGKPINSGDILFEITKPEQTYASLLIPASDAEHVKVGQPAEIRLRQTPLKGTVTRIYPKVENNQITVEVDLENEIGSDGIENLEIVGQIIIAEALDVVTLETPMSINKKTKKIDLFVRDGDIYRKREVHIGVASDDKVEIVSGLSAGEKVSFNAPAHLIESKTTLVDTSVNG